MMEIPKPIISSGFCGKCGRWQIWKMLITQTNQVVELPCEYCGGSIFINTEAKKVME